VPAYYTADGPSNARTDAINGSMKKAKRIGHGFRNRNYRLQLLLHCAGVTWQDQPAARLRKRTTRIVACYDASDGPDPLAWRSALPWRRPRKTTADNFSACELGGTAATSVAPAPPRSRAYPRA
jgi:hypothetical protein